MKRYVESIDHAADNRRAGDFLHVHPATLASDKPGIVIVNGKHLQFLSIRQALKLATKIADNVEVVKNRSKTGTAPERNTAPDRPPLILASKTTGAQ